MFGAWGRFVYRFRWLVLVGSIALAIGSVVAIGVLQTKLSTSGYIDERSESARAFDLTTAELPAQGARAILVFTAKDPNLRVTDPAYAAAVDAALAPLRADPRVAAITQQPTFVSRDGRRSYAIVGMRDEFATAVDYYEELRQQVRSDALDIVATGELPINEDFIKVSEQDLRRAELISLPLVMLLLTTVFGMVLWRLVQRAPGRSSLSTVRLALALVFGALAVALIPVVVGALAIFGALAGIFGLAQQREMSVYAVNIATMIGLGVAIDYSLFVVSRFLEEVPRRPVAEAIERTMATSGQAIAFSGFTVAIGLAGLLFYHLAMLNSIGLAGMLVVLAAVFYGLTFLPAFLAIVGTFVAARLRKRGARSAERGTGSSGVRSAEPSAASIPHSAFRTPHSSGFWHALTGAVMDHPWATLLPVLALLLVAGSPFLDLRLGESDATVLPTYTESRQGFDLLRQEFVEGDLTRVLVVVNYPDGQPLGAERVGRLYDYSRWLASLPNVARVESPVDIPGPDGKPLGKEQVQALYTSPRDVWPPALQEGLRSSVGEHVVLLGAVTALPGDSDGTRELVRQIRAGQDAGAPELGGEVLVGGRTAYTLDQADSIMADTPRAAAFIIGTTYVVLFLLLGSLLLPLKAVAMNLLSITASYGALVWIFQQGHLSGLLNFTPGPISATTPVLMFCTLFGLSMDYEVLLLSRMKEEYDRSGDNRYAVAEGLEQTGRLITGAAAIMVGVFGAFAVSELVVLKSIGVGMAIAVALDALVVRTLLVPATMRLLGNLNWWAPGPLARLHRRLGLAHHSGDDAAEAAAPAPASLEREPVPTGRGD